ncbi:hypothetical protein [Thermomonospora umbrina]|uniref:Uncharacterized protein n=1 Tax=Thermomonospora umbrina TaxID=111806 RepID=A0A3D9SNF7_9ACTN|nr:hypothetical protein [Thermomonospora umbrina]REE97482.1 hypothetical protein DFJ69_2955 [Thermomonospora umbrina]
MIKKWSSPVIPLALALALAVLGLSSPHAFAAERLRATVDNLRTLNGPLVVHTYSERPVASVNVGLAVEGEAPYATVADFTLVSTTRQTDWPYVQKWQSAAPVRQELNSRASVSIRFRAGDSAEVPMVSGNLRPATWFEPLQVTPTTVDAGDPRVTVRGRLFYKDADGQVQGAHGAIVRLHYEALDDPITTGPDGRFEHVYYAHRSFPVGVKYSARRTDPYDHAYAIRGVMVTVNGTVPTRLSVEATPQGTVFPGDVITVTGKAEWQHRSGEWLPITTRRIQVRCGTSTYVRPAADGTFRVDHKLTDRCAVTATLERATRAEALEAAHAVANPTPDVHLRTRFQQVSPWPAVVARGDRVSVSGRLVSQKQSWGHTVHDARVRLEFSRDGQNWVTVDEGPTESNNSAFDLSAPARYNGHWRIRAVSLPDHHTLPETVTSGLVNVKDKTRVTGLNAFPEPITRGRALLVQGTLQWRALDGVWHGLRDRRVTVYFQAKGTKTWRAMGTAGTDARGRLGKRFTATRDGSWRVAFTGGPFYTPTTSSADYVDVR